MVEGLEPAKIGISSPVSLILQSNPLETLEINTQWPNNRDAQNEWPWLSRLAVRLCLCHLHS